MHTASALLDPVESISSPSPGFDFCVTVPVGCLLLVRLQLRQLGDAAGFCLFFPYLVCRSFFKGKTMKSAADSDMNPSATFT